MYKIKDFKVGQLVGIILGGNEEMHAIRHGKPLIVEWEVTKVGKKYVYAHKPNTDFEVCFEETSCNYEGLVEKTDYCVNYILVPSFKQAEEVIEKRRLYNSIHNSMFTYNANISLKDYKQIYDIIKRYENG